MSRLARQSSWVFILLLSGCTTMTFSFGQRVIVANSIVESAAVTLERLIVSGALTPEEGKKAADQLSGAAAAIDLAEGIYPRDPKVAGANLRAAIKGLEALTRYLEKKQHEHLERANTQSTPTGLRIEGTGDRRLVSAGAG